jgi:hypothetical protein
MQQRTDWGELLQAPAVQGESLPDPEINESKVTLLSIV